MKQFLLLTFLIAFCVSVSDAWAQERIVSGTVTSAEDNEPLPAVNVVLKGTTTGTVTDLDGEYSLTVPSEGGTLQFSFIGLTTQEIPIGNRSIIDVQMRSDVRQLTEVVVTAVGIQRQAKALGYSVEQVSGEQIQQVAEPDPLRALQGKVAGVNIQGSSGAPGSSTRITIRGNSSLLGDNEPLFIVDGVAYNNSEFKTFSGFTSGSATSNRFLDMDPNNIQSINILKGAAASALYGSRAANGVVVITTKTGNAQASRRGLEVSYSTSYSIEKIANLPDYQNTYGTGVNFAYQQVNGSWGAPFIGARPYATVDSITHWYSGREGWAGRFDGVQVPYRAYPDNVENLFKNGSVLENSVTINGGNENSALALTISKLSNDGYVPNTEFDRTNFSVGGRTVLENGLNFNGNLQYTTSHQKAVQSGIGGSGANNPSAFARALYLGRNWDVHGQPYQNPTDLGSEFMVGRGQADNPLWSYENAGATTDVDRVAVTFDAGYDFFDWFNVNAKIGLNSFTQKNINFIRPGSTGPASNPGVGIFTEDNLNFEEIDSYLTSTLTPEIGNEFDLRATVGMNINQRTTDRQAVQGLEYVVFDIDDIDNTNDVIPFGGGFSQRRIIGVFADASLGYRDWAFLGLTARNDWSSTLPLDNNSFFYPGVQLSVILSEALDITSDNITFLKLRGSWAEVGNDTGPYQLNSVFQINTGSPYAVGAGRPFLGRPTATLEDTEYDPLLKPETTREVELGIEAGFFESRINLDLSVYQKNSFNLIAPISLPSTTGFAQFNTNFGEISNRGIEIGFEAIPFQAQDGFGWNMYATFTHNKNTVEELTEVVPFVEFGSGFAGGVRSVHKEGEEYGLLKGSVSARDQDGNLLIDPSNGQLILANDLEIIGNPNPDFIFGLTNTFSYKGVTLSAVFDWKQGGDLFSNTVSTMLGRGVTKDTEDREVMKIIPGVYGDPNTGEPIRDEGGQKIPNQTMVEFNTLYFGETFAINGTDEWAVWDATVFRLRQLSLGYSLPERLLTNTPLGAVNISLVGRNLWFSAPNFPEHVNFDPEVNQFGTSNQQGIEWSATPTVERYSINLNVKF